MKILDVAGKPIQACCSFEYRGLKVSVSTIVTPNSIAVFSDNGSEWFDFVTVESALKFCDSVAQVTP